MPLFLATTSRGLQDVLFDELKELGFSRVAKQSGGVQFESNWEGCYLANLKLRTASRVLLPILDFPAYSNEDLYNNIRKHDFTKYIDVEQTISVDAVVRDCPRFRDQRFVAMKVKDAIVDQFWDKFEDRPDVDTKSPDLPIVISGIKEQFHVSLDTSGLALFKRGYRKLEVPAPLKETLAAGLLRHIKYDGNVAIVDPMCGSGTILIEAALMALKIAPGSLRRGFAFQKWKGFQKSAWEKVVKETMDEEKESLDFKFYGFDRDRDAVKAARANVEAAGLSDYIQIERQSIELLEPPCEKGIILTNPPYGERLIDENMKDIYRDFAFALKHRFKGWTAWMISGNPELTASLKLKATQKIPVMNGAIDCRLLKYEMF